MSVRSQVTGQERAFNAPPPRTRGLLLAQMDHGGVDGFSQAVIDCTIAAAAAALLTLIGLHGVKDTHTSAEAFIAPLVDPAAAATQRSGSAATPAPLA